MTPPMPSDCTSAHAFPRTDEQRQNELRRIEARFAHQAAQGLGAAEAAKAMYGEWHLIRTVTLGRGGALTTPRARIE
jgi:hypothetical protein